MALSKTTLETDIDGSLDSTIVSNLETPLYDTMLEIFLDPYDEDTINTLKADVSAAPDKAYWIENENDSNYQTDGNVYYKIVQNATLWSEKLTETLADKLSESIADVIADKVISHFKSNAEIFQVSTSVSTTVAPGIPVTTAGSALAQTGATTAPGTGTGSGTQTGTGKVR